VTAQKMSLLNLLDDTADRLSRATRLNRSGRRLLGLGQIARVSGVEANKNFVGCVLQPSVRLVQLSGSLARKLAELVAVGHMRKCRKN